MAAPKTVKTYPLAGTNRDFEIPFEYLARKFVIVTLIGTDRKELVLNVDYRFTQRTIITLTRVWGPEEGYNFIEIKRVTSATERLVDFSDGSILRASDLNTATVQALHIAEEGRDIATDTIGVDNNGQLDARGRQIKNLADGVDDGDAISMRQIRAYDNSALNSRNAAKVSETNAKASENAAAASRAAALVSQNAAKVSETNSAASASASATSSSTSKQWAANDEGVPVTPGLFSSYHYSRKAAASASGALVSQNAALVSQNAAKASEDAARDYAANLGNNNAFVSTLSVVDVTGKVVTWKDDYALNYNRALIGDTAKGARLSILSGEISRAGDLRISTGGAFNLRLRSRSDATGPVIMEAAGVNVFAAGEATNTMYRAGVRSGVFGTEATGAIAVYTYTADGLFDAAYRFTRGGTFITPSINVSKTLTVTEDIVGQRRMRVRNFTAVLEWESPWESLATVIAARNIRLAHEMGTPPTTVLWRLRCTVADVGYNVGDVVELGTYRYSGASAYQSGSVLVNPTDTDVMLVHGTSGVVIPNKTTNEASTITSARWVIQFILQSPS